MLKQISNFQKGFTLIELITVVGILAILSGFVITTLDPLAQFQKANDGRRKSDLTQIQRALELYYQDNKEYPTNTASYQIQTTDAGDPVKEWGSSWLPYMNILPKEKDSTRRYVYVASSNKQSYYLYISLERGNKDPQVCNNGNTCINVPSNVYCGADNNSNYKCNYGVTSSNVSP